MYFINNAPSEMELRLSGSDFANLSFPAIKCKPNF